MQQPQDIPAIMDGEEKVDSPVDRLKYMILQRWDRAENLYVEGRDMEFARATKSFERQLGSVLSPKQRHILKEINNLEERSLKNARGLTKSLTEVEAKLREIQVEYAQMRIYLLAKLLAASPVVQHDIETDFRIPDAQEEAKILQQIISFRMPAQPGKYDDGA
jgi:hypothetical protein